MKNMFCKKELNTSLHGIAGIWFSQLDCDRPERAFYYDFSFAGNDRHDAVYRCYGEMPDGSHVGASVFPSMTSFADFKDPPFTGIVIVDENSKDDILNFFH